MRFIAFLLFLVPFLVVAQQKDRVYDFALENDERTLVQYMWKAQQADSSFDRNDANYLFIRELVKMLRQPGAYHYPFDSLKAVSILAAPDNKFRLFSWQIKQDEGTYRHYGCIMLNDANQTLIPLLDQSDEIGTGTDTVLNPKTWYGAAYYQIVPELKKSKGITYYTLIGYDAFEPFSQRKIIDVLWFDKSGEAYFGAPIFQLPGGNHFTRVVYEYAKDATMQLRWDQENKLIIADHLVPRHENNRGLYFDYVADGSFDGFRFKKGIWQYLDNVDLRMKTP